MYHLWLLQLFAYAAAPLESAAEIVKDDCLIPWRPRRFNPAVCARQRILIPWQTDANFHPFLVSFREELHYVGCEQKIQSEPESQSQRDLNQATYTAFDQLYGFILGLTFS